MLSWIVVWIFDKRVIKYVIPHLKCVYSLGASCICDLSYDYLTRCIYLMCNLRVYGYDYLPRCIYLMCILRVYGYDYLPRCIHLMCNLRVYGYDYLPRCILVLCWPLVSFITSSTHSTSPCTSEMSVSSWPPSSGESGTGKGGTSLCIFLASWRRGVE